MRCCQQVFLMGMLSVLMFSVDAAVYQCTAPHGEVEFRERPCQSTRVQSTVLPYASKKTDPMAMHTTSSVESVCDAQRAQKRRNKQILRQQKKTEQMLLKAKRREARCIRTQEKLQAVNHALRLGCKPSRCLRLQEQLRHLERMQIRYCQPETPAG